MTVTDRERGLLAAVGAIARAENAAAAGLIGQIMGYIDSRCVFAAAAPGSRFDGVTAERSAIAELALELSTSFKSVAGLMRLGYALDRVPAVSAAFTAGDISLRKVRVIAEHTRGATLAALKRLDTTIAVAARRLAPGPLGVEIDRLLIEDDANWAERARRGAEATAKVRTHRRPHGMGVLSVTLTAVQMTAVTTQIAEVAKTVCFRDPRTTDELCVAAFLAITQGHRSLACHCTDTQCPAKTNPEPAPPQVRVNIMCGLETLLGLCDNPGYLAGYGYLDPAQTRALAEDATWQALMDCAAATLDRLRKQTGCRCDSATATEGSANSHTDDENDAGTDSDSEAANNYGVDSEADGNAGNSDGTDSYSDAGPSDDDDDDDHGSGDAGPAPGPPPGPETPDPTPQSGSSAAPGPGLRIFKSAVMPAGTLAPPGRKLPQPGLVSPATTINGLYRAILTDPGQIVAEFPDGHGGFTQPPPGALTYQPNDLLAAAVRLRDGTCRHPGCTVPAADCQIDHIVAFLKANPTLGGWTILANLQCLCVLHHQLKTAGLWSYDMLTGAIMHIHNNLGQHGLTLPVRRRSSDCR
ncbi:DUF222 domain-containing protein [Rhodococcus sp. NPDC058514]|uniref:HNH endonuclease signature motif containing protein n=1 Tax=Rhodococcus sp. NPDC058514 TaxID=3346532 RepID=UPI00365687C0